MAISLGVHIGQQNMAMPELRSLWRKLDTSGVDWISAWDHFYESPPSDGTQPHFEALATLGALAAETERARIGCLVFCVGYRNPALLAKAATTLDHITGGRFELGIGAGWHIQEAASYGYPFPDIGTRLDMLDEAAEILQRMLSQDRTSFSGRHFQVDNASCLPKPVQARLPIWIGGLGERRTLEIAARRADGWNAAYVSPEEYSRLNSVLDHWCEIDQRDPKEIRRGANIAFGLAMDDAGVKAERERIEDEWGADAQRIIAGSMLGTPNQAADHLMKYVEAGANEINIALRAPWNAEALEAYLTEVIPQIRKETTRTTVSPKD